MIDPLKSMAQFVEWQKERTTRVLAEIEHYKSVVIAPLAAAGIARIEVRFDGCGDSGAVEQIDCLDAQGVSLPLPDVSVGMPPLAVANEETQHREASLAEALESLTYLALEQHHPGWENNDGACGELVIEVDKASFVLDCQVRYTAYADHSNDV